jgi:hypothetical protein
VLRETTSRGLCGLVCPSRTSERGGEGDCVKEGGEKKGSARGSVHWSGYDTTALDIEVDPQRYAIALAAASPTKRRSLYRCVCVFITAGPSTKMFTWGGDRCLCLLLQDLVHTRDDEPT